MAPSLDAWNARMPRRRNRLNWLYDNDLQQFTTPSGQIVTLLQIAQLLQDQVNCSHDFAGPWHGWRIRQNRLIAPGQTFKASQITPGNLRAFSRWLQSFEGEQAQLQFDTTPYDHQANTPPASDAESADTKRHASIELRPPRLPEAATTHPEQERAKHEPRQRAAVIELAAFRQRRIAAEG